MKTLFTKANVLSMKTDEISWSTDVLVENGKIISVGKSLPQKDASVINCTGKYLLPALFDAHAHLNSNEMGRLFIANGITTIRSLSGDKAHLVFGEKVRTEKEIGPYIYSSGPIIDGINAEDKPPNRVYISSLEDAESNVYDVIENGYQWVKTYPSIEVDHLERLMKTANDCGIKVCGHMSYFVDAKVLRDWGYHCCEHSSSLPNHPNDIKYLAESGMWFCPTQVVCETLPDYVWNGKKLSDLEYYEYVPGPLKAFWEDRNQKIIAGYKKRNLKPDINMVINRGRTFMEYSDRYMAGSDTMYPGMIAGFSLHDELNRLVDLYGCSTYETLKAATVNPAEYMGLEEQKGKIKAGMDADILILNANPLKDINNTRDIHAVMQGQRYYDRYALDEMLAYVKTMDESTFEFIAPLF